MPTPKTEPERITDDDLAELREAQETLSKAQAIWSFVGGRLARKYGLQGADSIQPDGAIVRAPVPAQEP